MNRTLRILCIAALPVAGFVAAVLIGVDLAPAEAGGVAPVEGRTTFLTSSESGSTVYLWNLTPDESDVVRFDFTRGEAVHKTLTVRAEGGKEPGQIEETIERETPEIDITGVIWTSDPETRVAIINGEPVREGETFRTRTGKTYRVTRIHRTEEVEYEEVKD